MLDCCSQVQALELFAKGAFPEAAGIVLSDLLLRLLAAASSSVAAVRAAAVEAFEHLPKVCSLLDGPGNLFFICLICLSD